MINLTGVLAQGIKTTSHWAEQKKHVSDLGVSPDIATEDRKCPRQFWLRYNGKAADETTPGQQLMFSQGHALEERVIEYIENGIRYNDEIRLIATQMDVSPGLPGTFTGRLDLLLNTGNSFWVVDIKTRRGNAFRYSNDIRPADKYQIGGYIHGLRMMGINAEGGIVLEVDREGQNFARNFNFDYTQELKYQIENTFQYVDEVSRSPAPPSVMPPKIKINENKGDDSVVADNPWQCRYCDFRPISCPGAIPPEYDDDLGKVIGHISDGEFVEKIEGIKQFIGEELE